MSAEVFESSAALARASLLLANLERATVDLSDLVRRTEREDASTTLAMAGPELSALGEQLGALVFCDNYASGHERDEAEEDGRLDEVVLAPEDIAASFRYDSLGPRFQQDIEKSKNIGVQRSQRMLLAYEHFRSEQDLAFRRKMHKIRNKSGIEKLLQTVAGKDRQLEKLAFELQSKRELLTAKNDPTASNVTYAERELTRLLRCITDGRRHIADTLAAQGECDSTLDSLRLELADLTQAGSSSRAGSAISSFSNRKLSRFKANRKRYANSSHVELDMLEDSFSDIKRLVDDSAYVQQRIANCESEIKLKQETLEVMMRKDEFKELKRIRALCEKLHVETTSYKDRVQWLERSLLARIASGGVKLLSFDSYEGKQLVAGLLERKSNREAVKQKAREMRIQAQLPKPDPVPIRVPLASFNFHLAPQELYVAMQASTLLKSRLPVHDVSASGGIDQLPILKSSKLPEVGLEGVIAPPPRIPDPLENPLMNTMLAIGQFDQNSMTPNDDHGIPAILEQLQTIEDMLLGAPKRKPYDTSGGVEDIREELVNIKKEVVRSFKAIKEVTASIKTLESNQGGSLEERDALRVAFLEKIAGRDGMPLTISARQDEVNSLTNSLLEARANLKGLKKQLRATAKELESAQNLFDKLKATPILAAQEVERLEKEATSPKPLIRVEVKQKDPAKPKPPPASLHQQHPQQQQQLVQPQRPTTPSEDPTSSHPKAIIRVRVTTEKQARLPVPTVASANPLLCDEPPPVAAANTTEVLSKRPAPPEPIIPRSLRIAHVVNLSSSTALAPRGAARDGARPKHFSYNSSLQK